MTLLAFITEVAAVDRIIDHLNLMFAAEKPPPSRVFSDVALMAAASACTHGDLYRTMSAAEESGGYFMDE